MCGLQLSPCSFSELAVSLSFPFSVASLYHAGDPTTQEGGKYGYCMDWGDCDQCIDDNKHCLPLGTEHWNWECIDNKVHATYFWSYPTKKCLFKVLLGTNFAQKSIFSGKNSVILADPCGGGV